MQRALGYESRRRGIFATGSRSTDPRSGEISRHHLHEQSVQRAVCGAAKRTGIVKPCSPHLGALRKDKAELCQQASDAVDAGSAIGLEALSESVDSDGNNSHDFPFRVS